MAATDESVKIITLSSGVQVRVPRVAVSALMLDLGRKNPKPLPPAQVVKLAGVETTERNYAHPNYRLSLAEWDDMIKTLATEYIIRATAFENEAAALKDKELIERVKKINGDLISDQPDEMIWLQYIAMKTNEDVDSVILTARTGEPSEEGIKSFEDGFRDQPEQS